MNTQNESTQNKVEVRLMGLGAYSYDELSVHWLVEDQAYVETGDPIAEIESGKASHDLEANEDGVISILMKGDVHQDRPMHTIIEAVLATIETPDDALLIR